MIKILIAGDYYPQHRVADLLEQKRYDMVFENVKPVIENVDYAIINLESPIITNTAIPIEKSGPNLKSKEDAVAAIKYAGFHLVTLANNHFFDYGEQGVFDTLEVCENYGIDTVGGGRKLVDAQRVLYKQLKNRIIAIINCCEHEFSIANEHHGGSNPLNPIANYYQIQEARNNADYVIVITHGGHELFQLPSPRMKETFRFFIDAGADAVINHHQHCFSGYEIYKCKPIFFGIGNFSFDVENKVNSMWNEGYMVELAFKDSDISFRLHPYSQGNQTAGIKLFDKEEIERFNINILQLNAVVADDKLLKADHEKFMKNDSLYINLHLEPYNNKYLKILYAHKLLPSFLEKKKLSVLNLIQCESHKDSVIYMLKNLNKY